MNRLKMFLLVILLCAACCYAKSIGPFGIDWTDSVEDFLTTGSGTFSSLDVDTLNFDGNDITDSTGVIDFDNENLITDGSLTLEDGAEHSEIYQSGDWLKIDTTTGSGVSISGGTNIILLGGAAYWGTGTHVTQLRSISATPTIFQRCVRASGGIAFDMFDLSATNTTYSNTETLGKIGMYGHIGADIPGADPNWTPYPTYMFLDARTTAAYNSATLKIDTLNRVGIGLANADRPQATLDVAGTLGVTGKATFGGDVDVNEGMLIQTIATIDVNDTTPDVSGGNIFVTSSQSDATEITDLDSPVVGQIIYITGGSNDNSSTIADGGNFNLSAGWTASLDDVLILLVQADNDYIELGRVNN